MNEKFMSVKTVVIPTITAIVIASQLLGCAAVSQDGALNLAQQGESITITVPVPSHVTQETGTEQSPIQWLPLAEVNTNPELQSAWDDILKITKSQSGKNGVLYVDHEGNLVQDNTLFVAAHNKKFTDALSDEDTYDQLIAAVVEAFPSDQGIDIESSDTLYAGINTYFQLRPDNQASPATSNAHTVLKRGEFMAMLTRSTTPANTNLPDETYLVVYNPSNNPGQEASSAFNLTNQDGSKTNDYNQYAEQSLSYTYLTSSDNSLTPVLYDAVITRGEVIHALVQKHFKSEFDALTDAELKSQAIPDIKVSKQQASSATAKLTELKEAVSDSTKPVPQDIVKSLIIARKHNIITEEQAIEWSTASTVSEATQLIFLACQQDESLDTFSFNRAGQSDYEASTSEGVGISGTIINIEESGKTYDEKVQAAIDSLDERLAKGEITKEKYDKLMARIKSDAEKRAANPIPQPKEGDTYKGLVWDPATQRYINPDAPRGTAGDGAETRPDPGCKPIEEWTDEDWAMVQ